jgi:hypothetical protein
VVHVLVHEPAQRLGEPVNTLPMPTDIGQRYAGD